MSIERINKFAESMKKAGTAVKKVAKQLRIIGSFGVENQEWRAAVKAEEARQAKEAKEAEENEAFEGWFEQHPLVEAIKADKYLRRKLKGRRPFDSGLKFSEYTCEFCGGHNQNRNDNCLDCWGA